jgi:DNA polymerase-1
MNRLVLIDGNAVLHRAYHALPPTFTAPDGRQVNAVYGFTTMLLRLITDLAPTHVAVAFDRPKPTFRKEMFEGYQAKRPKMDEELVGQIGPIHDVITAFGIPIYEQDGYEADDVIGTLAKKSKYQVIIVTGDRDILQLVDDKKVFVYMPTKGLSEAKLYDEKEVKARMGVAPANLVDYKALAGDPSDNYPGVGGIGPKTAADLINTFGSIEDVYKAIDKRDKRANVISSGTKEKLLAGREMAVLSKRLAAIHTDVPIEAHVSALGSLDTPAAKVALEALGFRSILKRLEKESQVSGITNPEKAKKEQKKDGEQQALF